METIAAYWWLWLLGLLLSFGIAIWQWFKNVIGFGQDTVEILSQTHETFGQVFVQDVSNTQKAYQVSGKGLNLLRDKIKGRMAKFMVAVGFIVLTWTFGALLLVSIILHIIDYVKGVS